MNWLALCLCLLTLVTTAAQEGSCDQTLWHCEILQPRVGIVSQWPSVKLQLSCEPKDSSRHLIEKAVIKLDEQLVGALDLSKATPDNWFFLNNIQDGTHELQVVVADSSGSPVSPSIPLARSSFTVASTVSHQSILDTKPIVIESPPAESQAELSNQVNAIQLTLARNSIPPTNYIKLNVQVRPHSTSKDFLLGGLFFVTRDQPTLTFDATQVRENSDLDIVLIPVDGNGQELIGSIEEKEQRKAKLRVTVRRRVLPCTGMECLFMAQSNQIPIEVLPPIKPHSRVDVRREGSSSHTNRSVKCRLVDLHGSKRIVVRNAEHTLRQLIDSIVSSDHLVQAVDKDGFAFSESDTLGELCDLETVLILVEKVTT